MDKQADLLFQIQHCSKLNSKPYATNPRHSPSPNLEPGQDSEVHVMAPGQRKREGEGQAL